MDVTAPYAYILLNLVLQCGQWYILGQQQCPASTKTIKEIQDLGLNKIWHGSQCLGKALFID
jgi:hypothetical protein